MVHGICTVLQFDMCDRESGGLLCQGVECVADRQRGCGPMGGVLVVARGAARQMHRAHQTKK